MEAQRGALPASHRAGSGPGSVRGLPKPGPGGQVLALSAGLRIRFLKVFFIRERESEHKQGERQGKKQTPAEHGA